MIIKYYGCRGSIPAPGPKTLKYGGNTTCVSVEVGGEFIIFDAGSGLRLLGNSMLAREFGKGKGKGTFFFTHVHWDHIHGFPFFIPAYITGNRFSFWGQPALNLSLETILSMQQQYQNFPVLFEEMPAEMDFHQVEDGVAIRVGDVKVMARRLNHPGGVLSYSVEGDGKKFVFATDVEHYSRLDDRLAGLADGADLLTYDAQYTPNEYLSHIGWGHSTWEEGIKVAQAAGVKTLHLTHHDPDHEDALLEQKILKPAREKFDDVELAREDWEFTL